MQQPPAKSRVKRGTAQQHLLDAAQQLFAERGYRGTTTKDIAQHAGVSENLIFRYFTAQRDSCKPLSGLDQRSGDTP